MQIKVISLTEEEIEKRDYRNEVIIKIDDEKVFEVRDGEPEDSNLFRDFSDVWKVPSLMQRAYDAGKKGEPLGIVYEESEGK